MVELAFKKATVELSGAAAELASTFAKDFNLELSAVINAIVTDWIARFSAEIEIYGKSKTNPFMFDDQKRPILGNQLYMYRMHSYLQEMKNR
jgi:hypothetical protein